MKITARRKKLRTVIFFTFFAWEAGKIFLLRRIGEKGKQGKVKTGYQKFTMLYCQMCDFPAGRLGLLL